jgi:acetylornithine deacetylase/succinyl-diaminopimelate desuccinylase-like protein
LYGLGSADDKGPLLAMLCAALRTKHHQLKRPLMMMGTFGEECGMPGAIHCVEHWRGPKPCCAIVGEPTSLGITYRHKGLGVIEIELKKKNIKSVQTVMRQTKRSVTFRGKQGHSSRPHLGDNALDKLMHFLGQRVKRNRRIRVLSIHGGSAANLIPGSASLEFQRDHDDNELSLALVDCYQEVQKIVKRLSRRVDRSFYPSTITSNFGVARTKGDVTKLVFDFRLLPGQSIRSIYRELDKCLKKRLRLYPTLTWRAYVERANLPLGQDRKYPFVKAGTKLLKQERLPLALSVKPSCTEAGVYAQWGVPSFVFGPGRSSGNIHAPNESIRISEIKRAIKFYTRAIQTFCVEGKPCS